jgi:glutamine amidotransferase
MEVQPAFLRPNVRGDTDSELFFYLFLSYLHDEGHLDRQNVPTDVVHQALRDSLRLVDGLCTEAGLPKHSGDILLTNGESLIGVHRSGKMAMLDLEDPELIASFLRPEPGEGGSTRNLDHARCTVLASEMAELPQGWRRVAGDSLITATRTEAPTTLSIEA